MTIKVGVLGCLGRMGRAITAAILETDGYDLAGGSVAPGGAFAGTHMQNPHGGNLDVYIYDDATKLASISDVLVDFTVLRAIPLHLAAATAAGTPLVIGTTGLTAVEEALIDEASKKAPILQSGNMSLGVNLLMALTEKVARTLGDRYDIEIMEMHHRHKVDAPSGTALMLGEGAARGRGVQLDAVACRSRDGIIGERPKGEIGFASLRGGGVVGDHTVIFASENERLELCHKAADRGLFAEGALRAALWLTSRPNGRYTMIDVLDL